MKSGVVAGCVGAFLLLLLYNGGSDCPRYTAIFNLFYMWLLADLADSTITKKSIKCVISGGLSVILLIQSFITIDPAIILHKNGMYTGSTVIKELDFNETALYNDEVFYLGDLYTYNIQSNFYDGLIASFLKTVSVPESFSYYVLDVPEYEMHLHGIQYPMYWNTRLKRMTYDGNDEDSVFLNGHSISTELVELYGTEQLGSNFYLLVPARIDEQKMLTGLKGKGYQLIEAKEYRDIYGSMRVYGFGLR